MPGSQLVNRLQDLNYRVHAFSEPGEVHQCAESDGPMIIFLDLESEESLPLIIWLRTNPVTSHIPVVAFGKERSGRFAAANRNGANLVVGEAALLSHLPSLLEQVLRVD